MAQSMASQGTPVSVLRADSSSSLESLNTITNAIRNRANQLSQSQGGSSGDATRNWLQAERDLFCVPEATLSENDQQFNIQVAAPGCNSGNMEVIATSDSLIVRSTSNTNSSLSSASAQGSIVYSDVDSRMIFRRFDLSSSIDTGQVSATMDNGLLNISAQKAMGSRRSSAAKA
jgi:HSP20 family molecular chaperone IbpA